jgi:two-component system OmpR family response regulator
MTPHRILHVDDEPDIREIVELSLGLDPGFTVHSCASGDDALATAVDWPPDLILCDVMMPVMDGPTTLARLRECPQTINIPVVFMTARAQTRELEHFRSLGATGVIAKPFDPMKLANSVRDHLRSARLAALRHGFIGRLRADAAKLAKCRANLKNRATSREVLEETKSIAHALGGAAGIFDFEMVSSAASALERSTIETLSGNGALGKVEHDLDALLACLERA